MEIHHPVTKRSTPSSKSVPLWNRAVKRSFKRRQSNLTLIVYDTETTGTNTAFDQTLQFAAIRTDDDLNERGRMDIRSRLLPWVIPSPGALRATGMTIDDLLGSHPSHYEMVSLMRRTLAKACPATFIGYNSLRFDEELLRQAFYQCLHPPYLTNTSGSTRADALHLVRAAAFLHPGSIIVPTSEKGRPSYRLVSSDIRN